ncbi:MAG: lipocalin family protein [Bacteroidales bacterium]
MNKLIPSLLIFLLMFSSCKKETDNISLLPGFWTQESITEDGNPVTMSACEQSTRLLIEQNGIYRMYSSCDGQQRYGTWIITGNTMLDISLDHWNGSNKYESFPVRFTILKLTGTEMEIRVKTYIGERKKTVMFTPVEQDVLTGKTPEELLQLDRYNKTLKTYTYRFVKQE